jgi:hypothetical protein
MVPLPPMSFVSITVPCAAAARHSRKLRRRSHPELAVALWRDLHVPPPAARRFLAIFALWSSLASSYAAEHFDASSPFHLRDPFHKSKALSLNTALSAIRALSTRYAQIRDAPADSLRMQTELSVVCFFVL